MKNKKLRKWIAVLLIILFTFSVVPKSFQNDTFYIIELGNQIMKTGVDWQDHYSIHNHLEYRYPHWAFDVINAWIYNNFGYYGNYVFTQILASVFMLLVFWNMRKKGVNFNLAFFSTLVTAYLMKKAFYARGQVVSYSLFLLEYMILENFVERPTFFKTLALFGLSMIMANIHSTAWIMMLVLLLPFIGEQIIYAFSLKGVNERLLKKYKKDYQKAKTAGCSEEELAKIQVNLKHEEEFKTKYAEKEAEKTHKITIERKPNIKYIWVAFVVLVAAALCTPLKLTPIIYVMKTSLGNSMNYINEHLPTVLANNIEMFTYTIIIVALLGFTNSKLKLYDAFLVLGLYIMALSGRRNVYLLIGLTAGIIVKMIQDFANANLKPGNEKSKKSFFICISIIAIIASSWMFWKNREEPLIDTSFYPVKATKFIKENLDYQNIRLYNHYEYGSYLLKEGVPVFIDSRCDLYTPEFNKDVVVLDDYMEILYGEKSISSLMDTYKLEYALVPIESLENVYMEEDDNYTELYRDKYFVIYQYEK